MKMSKKKCKQQAPEVEILLSKGEVTIEANTRDDIYKQAFALLKAMPLGTQWERSAVMFDAGIFKQIYKIKK